MSEISRGFKLVKKEGVQHAAQKSLSFIYRNYLRDYCPTLGYRTENSVRIEKMPILEPFLWPENVSQPEFEAGIVAAHEKFTRPGDSVVIIGGGKGISAVRAGQIVAADGDITIYEGGKEATEQCRRVYDLNQVQAPCQINHTIVGEELDIIGGDSTQADTLSPTQLPDCDVLELDCEGSEADILTAIFIAPRIIIVEVHPYNFSEHPDELLDELSSRGYEISYQTGHDAIPLSDEETSVLLEHSNEEGAELDMPVESDRVDSNALMPIVITAVRSSNKE